MAYFQRRRGKQVTVYYWDSKQGKVVPLPRKETLHLDDLTDLQVQRWLESWENEGGRKRARSRRRSLFTDDELSRLYDLHLQDHEALYSPRKSTMDEYKYHFTYIEEYFVKHLLIKDVRKWWLHTANYGTYLKVQKGLETPTIRKLCHTLARFGEYLVTQGIILQPWLVRPPRQKGKRKTPLIKTLNPEQAIDHARILLREKRQPVWALEILLSYFGSLRPEEVYALELSDFLTGTEAKRQAKTYDRFQKFGLGSGLSISITKTLTGKEVEHLTKTHYATGVVNVWSVAGAKMIAEILRTLEPGRLFREVTEKEVVEWTRNQVNYRYQQFVKPVQGLNAGDRRRASANYLAKVIGVDPILLQDHLRHSEMETTLLYTRDPAGGEKDSGKQDFTDVG